MNNSVQTDVDLVDLGDIRIETRGSSMIGQLDEQNGLKTFMPGIQADD